MADWRERTKFVALFDLVLTVITMLFLCYGIVLAYFWTTSGSDGGIKETGGILSGPAIYFIVTTALLMLLAILQLYANFRLLKSIGIGTTKQEILRMTRFWQIVQLLFIGMTFVAIMAFDKIAIGVNLIIRGVFLYIVYKFKKEVEEENSMPEGHKAVDDV